MELRPKKRARVTLGGFPRKAAQHSPIEIHDGVIRGGIPVWRRRGHTVVHKQSQWHVAASVDFGLKVSYVSQLEGGEPLLSTPVL